MWEWLPATIPSRLEAAPTVGDRKTSLFDRIYRIDRMGCRGCLELREATRIP
jgi:hypothetical protein